MREVTDFVRLALGAGTLWAVPAPQRLRHSDFRVSRNSVRLVARSACMYLVQVSFGEESKRETKTNVSSRHSWPNVLAASSQYVVGEALYEYRSDISMAFGRVVESAGCNVCEISKNMVCICRSDGLHS